MGPGEIARAFRLWPSERVLWHGAPVPGVPREPLWLAAPLVAGTMAAVSALFAALLATAAVPGWQRSALVACWALVFAVGALLSPRYLLDRCEFVVTDRRVLLRSVGTVRSIDRRALSFARVVWHRSVPGVGRLELVRAVPFGPLSRSQRLVLHDLRAPDRVLAVIRGVTPSERLGDGELPLTDRLDAGERVLWGGGPEGSMLGWREVTTAVGGAALIVIALRYGGMALGVLLELESVGLPVGGTIWSLLFAASLLTFLLVLAIGGWLVWWGTVRARAVGSETEYLVTDRRVLVRRGRAELSLDRARIVDLAERRGAGGLRHAFFILDGPEGRALSDGGALGALLPSRDAVPPILWEVRDTGPLREALFGRTSRPDEAREPS